MQEDALNGVSASHVLAVRRLQTRWRCRARATKVTRRHRFYSMRPAAICPSREDLAEHCECTVRTLKKAQKNASEDSMAENQAIWCNNLDGMKIAFSARSNVNGVRRVMRNTSKHSRTNRFPWLKGSGLHASYSLHSEALTRDGGSCRAAAPGTAPWPGSGWLGKSLRAIVSLRSTLSTRPDASQNGQSNDAMLQ